MTKVSKSNPATWLKDYDTGEFFDELFGRQRTIQPHYAKLHAAFADLDAGEFATRLQSVNLSFLRQGVTFNVYGDSRGRSGSSRLISCRESSRPKNGTFSSAASSNALRR
jgi:hypothetical protein